MTFIRPYMEFTIQAWFPYLKHDIECLVWEAFTLPTF